MKTLLLSASLALFAAACTAGDAFRAPGTEKGQSLMVE